MADVRGSGGIMLSQAEQGMKLFKAAEVGKVGGSLSLEDQRCQMVPACVSTSIRCHHHVELT